MRELNLTVEEFCDTLGKEDTLELMEGTDGYLHIVEKGVYSEDMMLPRFNDGHSIFLYCITDKITAGNMLKGKIRYPIKLYETIEVANKIVNNLNMDNKQIVRFGINLDSGEYYDEFTMSKDKAARKERGVYWRELNKQFNVIEYTIQNSKSITKVDVYTKK